MATAVRHEAAARLPAMAILASVAVFIVHLPAFAHRLLDGDEAVYGSIAALMNLGGGLYGDGGVDNKPPGIFWIYALTFRVFGAYQTWAVHAVAFIAMAVTCSLIYLIARDLATPRAGILAALFYGVLTAAGNPRLLAANTEIFMMLPLTASVLCMLRRQWFWTGLLLMAAVTFRQSAAVDVILIGVALWCLEQRTTVLRAAALTTAGALTGLAVATGLIAISGSLPGFSRWTIGTLVGYASTNWTPSLVWMRARDSILPFLVDMVVFW